MFLSIRFSLYVKIGTNTDICFSVCMCVQQACRLSGLLNSFPRVQFMSMMHVRVRASVRASKPGVSFRLKFFTCALCASPVVPCPASVVFKRELGSKILSVFRCVLFLLGRAS